jgi:hypothetical protein
MMSKPVVGNRSGGKGPFQKRRHQTAKVVSEINDSFDLLGYTTRNPKRAVIY